MEIIEFKLNSDGKKRLYSMLSNICIAGRRGNTGCPEWDNYIDRKHPGNGWEKVCVDYHNFNLQYPENEDSLNCFLCQRIFSRPSNHRCPCFKAVYTHQEVLNWLSINSVTGHIVYSPDFDTIMEGTLLRNPIESEPKNQMIRKHVDDLEYDLRNKYRSR